MSLEDGGATPHLKYFMHYNGVPVSRRLRVKVEQPHITHLHLLQPLASPGLLTGNLYFVFCSSLHQQHPVSPYVCLAAVLTAPHDALKVPQAETDLGIHHAPCILKRKLHPWV